MAQGSHSAGADETIRFLFEDDVTARPRNGHRRFGTRGAEAESTNPRDRRRLHARNDARRAQAQRSALLRRRRVESAIQRFKLSRRSSPAF